MTSVYMSWDRTFAESYKYVLINHCYSTESGILAGEEILINPLSCIVP
jgi:hypothetical protein